MSAKPVLFLCSAPEVSGPIARDLELATGVRVCTYSHLDEAFPLAAVDQYALILLYVDGALAVESVDGLLWACSAARRPVPLVALAESYDEAEALTYFRMGLTDYLSLTEHRNSLSAVVLALLPPLHEVSAEHAEVPGGSSRDWAFARNVVLSRMS